MAIPCAFMFIGEIFGNIKKGLMDPIYNNNNNNNNNDDDNKNNVFAKFCQM
jgi:hypothetical protein